MAVTWKVVSIDTDDTKKIITIQEIVNGTPGEKFSVKKHKTAKFPEFSAEFKQKILHKRLLVNKEASDKSKIDLSNFELFLNS